MTTLDEHICGRRLDANPIRDVPGATECPDPGAHASYAITSNRLGQARARACYFCGKALSAHAGFIETIHQPDGLRRDFCSPECLHWQLHEDEKAE